MKTLHPNQFRAWCSHLNRVCGIRTLLLFTVSEHKTIVLPWSAFGVLSALSGPAVTTNLRPTLSMILQKAPAVLLWTWLNILVFTVANQRLPESVVEDRTNKPWRPLPSRRLSGGEARRLLLFLIPVVYFATRWLGASDEAVIGMLLTWMYNDLKGSDESVLTRNLLNSCGLTCWSIGATRVACGASQDTLNSTGYRWLLLLGTVIFTTLQIQDFRDQEGDRGKGRRTLPLIWGDNTARIATAATMLFWSIVCPLTWQLGFQGYMAPVAVGAFIVGRLLCLRNSRADELTWKLWGVWMFCIFLLPLFKHPEALFERNGDSFIYRHAQQLF